ncbi:MAG: T9SS type A sorting domain-containing protein [Candidatus Electryonea clarkiae]|nr:T9SS type A sorting domain-containing protein [Candidatus Electryonea clarkiae]MDP8288246.1 T9SS type A sorting domain-containing protein [Candidatus Electryonea clarkiae]
MKWLNILLVFSVIFIATPLAAFERVSPEVHSWDLPVIAEFPSFEVKTVTTDGNSHASELDEYLGDTLIVGYTFQDVQHNSCVGRTIQYDPNADIVHVTYTDLPQAGSVSRHVMYNRILFEDDTPELEHSSYTVDAGDRAGFSTLAMCQNAENPVPVPVYHGRSSPADQFNTVVAAEYAILPGVFLENSFPWEETYQNIWPKSCMDGDSIVHVLSTTSGSDTYENWYTRVAFDSEALSFSVTNNGGAPEYTEFRPEFISSEIACSPDGERVAVAALINRARLLGEEEPDWFDQDLYIWINEDRGNDWDWDIESAMNITDFIDPDPELLPDSLAASTDTFRCYMETSLFFDEDNVLHVSFSTMGYKYYYGTGYRTAQLWYWNEENRDMVRVADGDFWNNTNTGANNIMIQRPSLYKDPDSGWLYILYQQMGIPGDTLTEGENVGMGRDRSEAGYANGELFMTASNPRQEPGYYWYKGVNITNTRGETGLIPAGDCRHERDPSIALNNEGDYLHIFYHLDLDAGASVYSTPEGAGMDNPQIYQRIPKADLHESLRNQEEWVSGLPIHIDERDFWDDPNGWEYENDDVREKGSSAVPDGFELIEIYPNPFNSNARIVFEMHKRGSISLNVYDVLGRNIITLAQGMKEAGRHEIAFNADDFASGIYFVKLDNGKTSVTRKIALIR